MIEAADQILVIDNGRGAERGRREELVRLGGKYAEFVKIRQMAGNWYLFRKRQGEWLPWLPIYDFGGIMIMPLSGKVKKKSKDRGAFAASA